MFFRLKYPTLIFLVLILCTLIPANEYENELRNNRSRLNAIKSEINNLKSQLSKTQKKALTINQQLGLIDKEMSLVAQAKGLLLREQQILERRSANNKVNLEETKEKLAKLKKLYSDRLVYMYKYGKVKNIELLLTAKSFNQALVRYRYLKLIAEYDEKTILSIMKKQSEIEALRIQLSDDLKAKNHSINNKKREEETYKSKHNEKNYLLAKVNKNKKYYQNQISIKQREQEKLTSIISILEKARKEKGDAPSSREFVTIDFDNFNKGKGKLPWPVHGKIVSKFGKQYDPVSKTSVNNSGIEIQSKIGTPVKCVFTGVVRMITYLGGYGNTIIIDHGKGFYTVYSHLGEIYVSRNNVVQTNQIIAQVGESGSLAGSKLHFEIYGGNQSFNPQVWLRK